MSASARASFAPAASRAVFAPLAVILGAGLILRLLFVNSDGFHNDVAAFESWTLTLRDNPPWQFYAKTNFSDYPPGYFVVLWVLSKLYALVGGANEAANNWPVLRIVIKLPAIAMDLVNAWVVYLIVRRYAAEKTALIAAAVLALNPAAIYASAYWGQVDSVSWGLVLVALLLVLRAGDEPNKTVPRLTWAWLAFAFSILIKPQAATLAFLFLAYPFATADAAVRARRLAGTGAGIVAALALAVGVGLLFHPAADVLGWLFGRYAFGSGVYPYNSVNAFNLYALRQPFWQPDNTPMSLFGLQLGTLGAWGVALVLAATALIVGRYLQRRDDRALLQAALLCALAFFILATRMHERYVYGAFLLAVPLIGFGRVGGWSSLVLTVTMYLNLAYSLAYQTAMETHAAGVDVRDLWPVVSHPGAFANVVLFFWLGYLYLGGAVERGAAAERSVAAEAQPSQWDRAMTAVAAKARGWFDPREGIVPMTRRDWMYGGGIALGAFVIAVIGLAWPPEKIFDEIYFARAGEEYLRNVTQFEWTHPPFTKLMIALSMAFWGGLHGLGDTSFGWRFLNVVTGSLECVVIYAFAKRLTGQTFLAATAAALLAFDGFHFVEERIATGEITIATLALLVLYALYRYLLAAQVRVKPLIPGRFGTPFWIAMVAGTAVAALLARLINTVPAQRSTEIAAGIAPVDPSLMTYVVAFVYFELGAYLLARWIGSRLARTGSVVSYADGTVVTTDGGSVTVQQPPATDPAELKVRVDRAGVELYATPAGSAALSPSGVMAVDGAPVVKSGDARVWLIVLAVGLGLLLSSKWNGVLDLGIAWTVVLAVSAQRFLAGRALYGNPRGFPIDIVLGVTAFTAATIYLVSYIPFFRLGNGFADLIALQQQMYWYHSHGVANATHPYSSVWWQWPLEQIPISYYYKDFRSGIDAANSAACCVAEILALPNPAVFLLGLVSVPFTAWLAWRERNKGYALLVLAYLFQWLPYARSPRILWEYHFFPNLAVIVLCDVVLIGYIARRMSWNSARWALGAYGAVVIGLFAFFYPVLAGTKVTYAQWYERMWPDRLNIPGTSWIIPHRDR